MANTTTTKNAPAKEATVLRGRDALKDICLTFGIKLGKKKQTKSQVCNPRSPYYNPVVAARRKKEKNRRHHNAVMRARGA